MNCFSCRQKTLGLFFRALVHTELKPLAHSPQFRPHISQFSTTTRHLRSRTEDRAVKSDSTPEELAARTEENYKARSRFRKTNEAEASKPKRDAFSSNEESFQRPRKEKERWQIHKAAIKEKLNGEAWNPRKKLSPDAMEGIRTLHRSAPDRFTTAVLADHFKVSGEAVRRILKGKWRPATDEQEVDRLKRWEKRGERIWENLVELGVKPPKKWREMGVGRAQNGEVPRWKSQQRNLVSVNDSWGSGLPAMEEEIDLIPTVHSTRRENRRSRPHRAAPLSQRL